LTQDKLINIDKNRLSKILGEAALIFVSVFIAIWLESEWQNRAEEIAAKVSLSQLLAELRADQEFLETVRLEQLAFVETSGKLMMLLQNPESLSKESYQDDFEEYGSPISVWPRRAAWTTMVSAGQLGLIEDKSLVARLGDFYEHRQRRLIYNSESYDLTVEKIAGESIPEIWDYQHQEFLTSDYEKFAALNGKIRWANGWAHWYLESLVGYNKDLSKLIVDVEKYLQDHGAVASANDQSS
jgi:hypothetical protein